jgi:chemotaxis protein CheD
MSQRVSIAEFRIDRAPVVLKAYGLGSCMAVALYDPVRKIGALGHMLLPNWSEKNRAGSPEKFVDAGIRLMLEKLVEAGAAREDLVAKIAGGANMFESEYQTLIKSIGARNAKSARDTLAELQVPLLAADVGGNRGRTIEFDLAGGTVIVYSAHDQERNIL